MPKDTKSSKQAEISIDFFLVVLILIFIFKRPFIFHLDDLYNDGIFYILLHEMPQMKNIIISQSKTTNIVIEHKDWKT